MGRKGGKTTASSPPWRYLPAPGLSALERGVRAQRTTRAANRTGARHTSDGKLIWESRTLKIYQSSASLGRLALARLLGGGFPPRRRGPVGLGNQEILGLLALLHLLDHPARSRAPAGPRLAARPAVLRDDLSALYRAPLASSAPAAALATAAAAEPGELLLKCSAFRLNTRPISSRIFKRASTDIEAKLCERLAMGASDGKGPAF